MESNDDEGTVGLLLKFNPIAFGPKDRLCPFRLRAFVEEQGEHDHGRSLRAERI